MKRWQDLAAAGLLVLHAGRVLHALTRWAATYDESAYLKAGAYLARHAVWDQEPVLRHPPLSLLLHGWILKPFHFTEEAQQLFWARVIVSLFAVAAGYVVYRWGSEIWSRTAGLVALLLYSFCPNVLAHSGLITSDMLSAALIFTAVYAWRRYLIDRKTPWLLISGVVTGAAMLSKFSAIILLPIAALLALARSPEPGTSTAVRIRRALVSWALLAGIVLFTVHAGYFFGPIYKPGGRYHPRSRLVRLSEPLLRVIPVSLPFVIAFDRQQYVNEVGHPAFLWGMRSVRGWWYYFPAGLFLKTPAAFLPLVMLALGSAFLKARQGQQPARGPGGLFENACLLMPPVAILVPLCFINHNNAGFRYALSVLPFVHLFIAGVFAPGSRKQIRIPAIALLAAFCAGSILAHPNYISYFSEWVGGSRQGYRYMADSSLDWGQDAREVERVQAEGGIIVNPRPAPVDGRIACNVNNYQDVFRVRPAFRWLHSFPVNDQISPAWLLWNLGLRDFEDWAAREPSSPEAHYSLGAVYFNRKLYEDADRELSRSLELNRDNPMALWLMARIRLVQGSPGEAQRLLEHALDARVFAPEPYQLLNALFRDQLRAPGLSPADQAAWQRAILALEHRYLVRWSLSTYAALPDDMNPARMTIAQYRGLLASIPGNRNDPETARLHNNLGFLLWANGVFPEAEVHLRRSIELQPDYMDPRMTLARLLQERGEEGEAQRLRKECATAGTGIYAWYNYFVGYGTDIVSLGNSLALPITE